MSDVVRIACECPLCGEVLVRRTRRSDGNPFLGCRGYPRCDFTESFDEVVQELGRRIAALEEKRPVPVNVSRGLRAVIMVAHPDLHRSPEAAALAAEVTRMLNALRASLE